MTTTAPASATSAEGGFRLIAESIPHIVWTLSPDGSVAYANRQATTYAGWRASQIHRWDWLSLSHPDDADEARVAWELAVLAENSCDLDVRLRRFDGTYRWHALHCAPIRDPERGLIEWIGTATDIDDARQREGGLYRAERRSNETLHLLELLQSKAPVGFGFVDRSFKMVHLNDTLAGRRAD